MHAVGRQITASLSKRTFAGSDWLYSTTRPIFMHKLYPDCVELNWFYYYRSHTRTHTVYVVRASFARGRKGWRPAFTRGHDGSRPSCNSVSGDIFGSSCIWVQRPRHHGNRDLSTERYRIRSDLVMHDAYKF